MLQPGQTWGVEDLCRHGLRRCSSAPWYKLQVPDYAVQITSTI